MAMVSLPVLALPANAAVVEPPPLPFDITIFPERDFVSVAWDGAGKELTFDLTRNGVVIGHAASAQVTPALTTDAAENLLEVNHPGGLCWAGSTPDILPGDRLVVSESGNLVDGIAATTQNVTAQPVIQDAAGNLVVTGTAFNADGSPMDLSLMEQRIIQPAFVTDGIGKRDIRATSDGGSLGLVTAGATAGSWVATYPSASLTAAQKADALAGETRGMAWQGTNANGEPVRRHHLRGRPDRRTGLRRMPGSGGLLDLRAFLGSQRRQHRRGSHPERRLERRHQRHRDARRQRPGHPGRHRHRRRPRGAPTRWRSPAPS